MSDHAISLQEADALLTAPGQMFETERAVVKGIEMTVWKNAPSSLRQMLDASRSHGDLEFLVYEDQRYTFREHYAIVATLAHRLTEYIKKGDRVAIASRNLPQWSMAFWSAAAIGAIVTPLNAWWTTDELAYGLRDSESSLLFVDGERLDRIYGLIDDLPALRAIVVLGDPARPVELRRHDRVPIVTFDEFLGEIDRDAPPDV
ncbi:MAG: class I adenylate-forming enzyme family protein, partial [Acidimicrobiales bacterium]